MAVRWHEWAWSVPAPSQTARLVLLAICDRADVLGAAWPGLEELATRAMAAPRTTQTALSDLQDIGAIHKVRRGYLRSDGTGAAPVYLVQGGRDASEFAAAMTEAERRFGKCAASGAIQSEKCAVDGAIAEPDATENAPPASANAPRTAENAPFGAVKCAAHGTPTRIKPSAAVNPQRQPAAASPSLEDADAAAEEKDPEPTVSEESRQALEVIEADKARLAEGDVIGLMAVERRRHALIAERADLAAHADWRFRDQQRQEVKRREAHVRAATASAESTKAVRAELVELLSTWDDHEDLAARVQVLAGHHVPKLLEIAREAGERNGQIKNAIGWIRQRGRNAGLPL